MWFLSFIVNNLHRRFARSLLTAGGVALAIGTSVALLGIAHGFQRASVEAFSRRGVDLLVMQDGVLDQLNSDVDASLADRLMTMPGVRDVAPGLVDLIDYQQENNVLSVLLQGWQPGSPLFQELKFLEGRAFTPEDGAVAVIGATLSKNLGLHAGDTITVQRQEFKIIGVYDSFVVFENGAITVPLADAQRLMVREGSVTAIPVFADLSERPDGSIENLCAEINALANDDGLLLGVAATPTSEYAEGALHIRMIRSMAWLTSLVAVGVGMIGVLNTMLMSVVERVREISILRAIGWRRSRIVRMIVGECLALSLVGAALGTLAAVLTMRWVATLPSVNGFIDGHIAPVVMAQGLAIAVLVGVVGAVYPALRAVRLQPTEGLAHD